MTHTDTKNFVLAGKAVFTVSNGKSGKDASSFTYKVERREVDSWDGRNPTTKKQLYFVSVAVGHTLTVFETVGVLDVETGRVRPTAQTRGEVVAADWALRHVWAGRGTELPNGASLTPHVEPARKPRSRKAPKPTFAEQRAAAQAQVTDTTTFTMGLSPYAGRTMAEASGRTEHPFDEAAFQAWRAERAAKFAALGVLK